MSIGSFEASKGEMVLLIGDSGSGKTSLLRRIAAHTRMYGEDEKNNVQREEGLRGSESGELISTADGFGYVWQNPSAQLVCNRVEQEIVFGMENLGTPVEDMHRRLAEVVTFFGMEKLLHRETVKLSAGEQQTVNIAGAMAMRPELLLLDEPTSALDPMAAERLVALIHKIHTETGVTILVAEQRPELFFDVADRIVVMEAGDVVFAGDYRSWVERGESPFMSKSLCLAVQSGADSDVAVSKRLRREWLHEQLEDEAVSDVSQSRTKQDISDYSSTNKRENGDTYALSLKNISFRYFAKGPDVLHECSMQLNAGSITALVGGNGSGKTTLAEVIGGYLKPYAGRIHGSKDKKGKGDGVSYLPANPAYLFLEDTDEVSGGELEMRGLHHVLDKDASLYILDEPTKGLDPGKKKEVINLLHAKREEKKTVLLVTHDIEFAAECADHIAMMFDGKVVTCEKTKHFLEGNVFYTTELQRLLSWG